MSKTRNALLKRIQKFLHRVHIENMRRQHMYPRYANQPYPLLPEPVMFSYESFVNYEDPLLKHHMRVSVGDSVIPNMNQEISNIRVVLRRTNPDTLREIWNFVLVSQIMAS